MRDTAAMTKTMMVAGLWILALGMPLTATAAQDAETMTANLLVNNCQAVEKSRIRRGPSTTGLGPRPVFLTSMDGWTAREPSL